MAQYGAAGRLPDFMSSAQFARLRQGDPRTLMVGRGQGAAFMGQFRRGRPAGRNWAAYQRVAATMFPWAIKAAKIGLNVYGRRRRPRKGVTVRDTAGHSKRIPSIIQKNPRYTGLFEGYMTRPKLPVSVTKSIMPRPAAWGQQKAKAVQRTALFKAIVGWMGKKSWKKSYRRPMRSTKKGRRSISSFKLKKDANGHSGFL